jgi:formylglycine-generating enzyme required for sulfatase activity
MPTHYLHREPATVQGYREDLGQGTTLSMVMIPAGRFEMGSPNTEPERRSSEGPQHWVTLERFAMGQYPVTQAQWAAVTRLPQVEIELEANPSRFKGPDRPVERVNWHEAQEFCARLRVLTGRDYGLPSEAQWEYACRAGTTTAFHFGEVISPNVANYDGNFSYNGSPKGDYKEETTPVGHYGVSNGYGLFDMHGNVWEWCSDHWHSSYEGAPNGGEAWIDKNAEKDASRVLRGGSWIDSPGYCRSAFRYYNLAADARYYSIGFRIVCCGARTQP